MTQTILLPQEIEVWYIIPSIRKELAKKLQELKMNQKEIAEAMGVTPSAINQYFKNKRAKVVEFDEKTTKEIEESAKRIKSKKICSIHEIQKICNSIRKKIQ